LLRLRWSNWTLPRTISLVGTAPVLTGSLIVAPSSLRAFLPHAS
jgi:hypothetical protein